MTGKRDGKKSKEAVEPDAKKRKRQSGSCTCALCGAHSKDPFGALVCLSSGDSSGVRT